MSTGEGGPDGAEQVGDPVRLDSRALAAVFGDRIGLSLFLASLCFVAVFWRAGVFISDNYTLVATLESLSRGHLWIEPVTDGASFDAPGAEVVDGYVYGRNYGQLFLSLPFLWLLQGLSAVADLTVALVGIWHLLVLALVCQLGRLLDGRRVAAVGGSVVVLASFLLTLSIATQLVEPPIYLLALQAASLVAGALVATVTYRLVARRHARRPGVLAGGAAVFVLPVGFWAPIPKRHVFTTLLVLGVCYAVLRSREAPTDLRMPVLGPVPGFRAMAYVLVGILTWIHAAEGLFVFAALVVVDVFTAPSNDRRTLAIVAGAFLVSMVPFFLTNLAITGQLHRPPRAISGSGVTFSPGGTGGAGGGGASGGGTGGGGGGGASGGGPAGDPGGAVTGIVDAVVGALPIREVGWLLAAFVTHALEGVRALSNATDLYHTFVKSGGFADLGGHVEFRGINLAVLESAPILAALAALAVPLLGLRSRAGGRLAALRETVRAVEPTDALASLFVAAFVLLFASRLPVHVQITGRYLLPIYPLVLYLALCSPLVRSILTGRTRPLLWSYAAGVAIGGQALFALFVLSGVTVSEAGQIHGYLGLGLAVAIGATVLASAVDARLRTAAAVALGLGAAAGTVFVVLAGLAYFGVTGEFVLPASRWLGELVAIR